MSKDLGKSTKRALCLAFSLFTLSPCRGDSPEGDAYFLKAHNEANNRQWDAALFDYTKAIDLDPANEAAHMNRGNIELRQGNLEGALADYNKAVELAPTDGFAYYDRGNLQYAKTNMAQALADFNKAIEFSPAYATAYNGRGLVMQSQGDVSGAKADFDKAIALDPNFAGAYANRGILEQRQGNLDKALADFDQAVKLDPQNGAFYNNLASVKLAKGDVAGARDNLKKSRDLNSDLSENSYRFRGHLEAVVHDSHDSFADFNRAAKIDPRDADIFVDLGRYKSTQGDISGALADYNEAISINSNDAAAYDQRGVAKGMSGDSDGAFADFNKALGLNPKYADVYCSRAFVEWGLGEDNAAMADVNQAIAVGPEFARAYNNRGWLRYDQRDFDDALADFQKSYQLDLHSQDFSRLCIWLIRAREGREAQATTELQAWLQDRKPRGTNDLPLKVAHYLTGTLSESDLLNAARGPDLKRTNAQCAVAWFFIASKLLVEGNEMGAKNCFEKCRATNAKGNFEYIIAAAELKYLGQNHAESAGTIRH